MEESLLQEISERYLVPLFSGATLGRRKSTTQDDFVAFLDPTSIAFKVDKADNYRLVLSRKQKFATASGTTLSEIAVVRAFIDVVRPMKEALNSDLKHDLLSTFGRRIVAKALSSKEERESTILAAIDQLASWAERSYEGAPITASLGFRHTPQADDAPQLKELGRHDFGAVLTNGHDTLLEFDFQGRLIKHVALPFGAQVPSFCPLRQAPLAHWTARDEGKRRVALALNRGGEILLFRDQQMLFTRRAGRWSFLTHEPVLTQMGTPQDMATRRAVYETCLDSSFAKTGACIGIVSSNNLGHLPQIVVKDADRVQSGASFKALSMQRCIGNKKFKELDRRLRQELVAIDGATVLSHEGDVLAVGSILKIGGGSEGGGRLAAARTLSELGLGIKVSQDGGITGFRLKQKDAAFQVM